MAYLEIDGAETGGTRNERGREVNREVLRTPTSAPGSLPASGPLTAAPDGRTLAGRLSPLLSAMTARTHARRGRP